MSDDNKEGSNTWNYPGCCTRNGINGSFNWTTPPPPLPQRKNDRIYSSLRASSFSASFDSCHLVPDLDSPKTPQPMIRPRKMLKLSAGRGAAAPPVDLYDFFRLKLKKDREVLKVGDSKNASDLSDALPTTFLPKRSMAPLKSTSARCA